MTQFDQYAQNYAHLVATATNSKNVDYFQLRKAEIIRRLVSANPQRILDFGAGVGGLTGHLVREFGFSQIFAEDVSSESLERLSQRLPTVEIRKSETTKTNFDLIVVSNVLHHIEPDNRWPTLDGLARRLAPTGSLIVIEHNPLNPLTRRVVDRCEFDKGVQLVESKDLKAWAMSTWPGARAEIGYLLFIPPMFSRLRHIEKHLKSIPLGAQFFFHMTNS